MLYDDEEQRIDALLDSATRLTPDIEVTDEYGVSHILWILNEPSVLALIQKEMSGRKLIIADGHHRYETALAYRDEQRAAGNSRPDAPHEWLPMTFFNMRSPALTVLPTHRVVGGVKDFSAAQISSKKPSEFSMSKAFHGGAETFSSALAASGRKGLTIGVAADGGRRCALLRLKSVDLFALMGDLSAKQRTLDVAVLHGFSWNDVWELRKKPSSTRAILPTFANSMRQCGLFRPAMRRSRSC